MVDYLGGFDAEKISHMKGSLRQPPTMGLVPDDQQLNEVFSGSDQSQSQHDDTTIELADAPRDSYT